MRLEKHDRRKYKLEQNLWTLTHDTPSSIGWKIVHLIQRSMVLTVQQQSWLSFPFYNYHNAKRGELSLYCSRYFVFPEETRWNPPSSWSRHTYQSFQRDVLRVLLVTTIADYLHGVFRIQDMTCHRISLWKSTRNHHQKGRDLWRFLAQLWFPVSRTFQN